MASQTGLPTACSMIDPMIPGTVVVAQVIIVPLRLGDIINDSVEVLHERVSLGGVFAAVQGEQWTGDWVLQLTVASWSKSRVQLGDDVIHLVTLASLSLVMQQVNCTVAFGHICAVHGWPLAWQGRGCPEILGKEGIELDYIHLLFAN